MWNYGAKFFDAWQVSRVAVVNDGKDLHLSLKCHLPFNVAVEKTNFMNVSILCMTTECSIAMFTSRKNRAATDPCIFLHENDPGDLIGFQFAHCTNGNLFPLFSVDCGIQLCYDYLRLHFFAWYLLLSAV
jgi:hypothetical protein